MYDTVTATSEIYTLFTQLDANKTSKIKALTDNEIAEANAKARNDTRRGSAAVEGAQTRLQNWVQAQNNKRHLIEAGEALESAQVNISRATDSKVRGDFAASIAAAEQAGASAAAVANSGVGGAVTDMINTSTALRDGIMAQQSQEQFDKGMYDTTRKIGSIASQMIGGLDESLLMNKFDFGRDVAQRTHYQDRTAAILIGAAEKGAGLYSGYQAGKEVKAEPTKTAHVTGGYESLAATSGKRESFTFNSGGDNTYLG